MANIKFTLGAHSLSSRFTILTYTDLVADMTEAFRHGAMIYEIPYLLCSLSWEEVAKAAKQVGIPEISLCIFFPRDEDGAAAGDPLGTDAERRLSLETIDKIINAAKIIRAHGIFVEVIDGPSWGCLGHEYNLPKDELYRRVVSFLREAGQKCFEAALILAVEFLRPHEDKVVGGTQNMLSILREVGHPAVKMHFDVFHSLECGEIPEKAMFEARHHIAYLHLHGPKRIAPGSPGDTCNWTEIVSAAELICSGIDDIAVIPEPFGAETCKDCPALGDGLPPMPPLGEYLEQAYTTFREAGMEV